MPLIAQRLYHAANRAIGHYLWIERILIDKILLHRIPRLPENPKFFRLLGVGGAACGDTEAVGTDQNSGPQRCNDNHYQRDDNRANLDPAVHKFLLTYLTLRVFRVRFLARQAMSNVSQQYY